MNIQIVDIPMKRKRRNITRPQRDTITSALYRMKVGQSALVDTSYYSAYSIVRMAKIRHYQPLEGDFLVSREGSKVRIGRIS